MQEYKVEVYDNGTTHWYNLEGQLHREDGAAIEYADGYKAWYLDGVKYTEEGWKRKVEKHTITIDGKTVEVSAESYENLKKLFD